MDVTTLIPAFNPKFLPALLLALKHQTQPPAQVIISDDSPEQVFGQVLKGIEGSPLAQKLSLTVIPGPRKGSLNNVRHLLNVWNKQTELFHLLCDDDLIYPEFYRWHVAAQQGGFKCSVSRRWTADESGQPLGLLTEPKEVQHATSAVLGVPADFLFPSVIGRGVNWLGEISNVVMHRDLADLYLDTSFEGIRYDGLGDIGTFLRASTTSSIGFITHPLGLFRRHAEQNTENQNRRDTKQSHAAWLALALASERGGYVTHEQAWLCIRLLGRHTCSKYANERDMAPLCTSIGRLIAEEPGSVEGFLQAWDDFLDQPADAAAQPVASTAE